ncbi:MAG: hypothetical protein Ta2F_07650 [Termitinemataceae bacterium]|nr:MAG: hypothetical protein Ta2F_07650 [Termitinemataceae bacterium]
MRCLVSHLPIGYNFFNLHKSFFIAIFFLIFAFPVFGQANVSVPVDDPVYRILEIAELRGLCSELSKLKPYTQKAVMELLKEIESNNVDAKRPLNRIENEILQDSIKRFTKSEKKIDLKHLTINVHRTTPKGIEINAQAGAGLDTTLSGAYYFQENKFYPGMNIEPKFNFSSDIGGNFSFAAGISGNIIYANRIFLGEYNVHYDGFEGSSTEPIKYTNTYLQPKAFFPYSYRPKWDGIVWNIGGVNNADFLAWPHDFSIGYGTTAELAGTVLHDIIFIRAGRFRREWGAMSEGSSLTLNKNAQPFWGVDLNIEAASWLRIASLTGILEYYSAEGTSTSSATFQNAYSLSQIELNYKSYLSFNFGTACVWPKRFEIGYLIPLIDKHFYQMAIGDFDNLAEYANLKVQYPGVAKLWGSFFLDEIDPSEKGVFKMDRSLFAYQAGAVINIPGLAFSTLSFMYTKIEPYCYTHKNIITPWYGDSLMEEGFINHGEPLAYYLKPNSDELKAIFAFMPKSNIKVNAAYQLIRHGADYGSNAPDGSSYYSELVGGGRSTTPALKKYFLHDGAYQWNHIVRATCEIAIPNTSFSFTTEAGVSHSYFTDIETAANSGTSSPYKKINTAEYPRSTGLIFTLGIHLNP